MQNKFKRDDLFIASVRFFNVLEENGNIILEISDDLARVIATRVEESGIVTFHNILDEEDISNVNLLKNSDKFDTSFGRLNGIRADVLNENILRILQSGECWLYENALDKEKFNEEVSQEELEDYILNSEYYFKNRKSIAEERLKNNIQPIKMLNIIRKDIKDEKYMYKYLGKRALGLEVKSKVKRK